jgi:hypothetical protein
MSFEENVKSFSPLYELDIDIIEHFSVDYMHQVNVVVTKQLLLLWISGPFKIYLSSNQLEQVSSKLSSIKKIYSNQICQKTKLSPACYKMEFNRILQFPMYSGPFALTDVLSKCQYGNFMCLHTRFCLLVNLAS